MATDTTAPRSERLAGPAARAFRLGLALALVACYAYAFWTDPAEIPGWTVCPTRLVTDLPCPSCGFGRGFILLSHGQLAEAFSLNVWSPLVYALGFPLSLVLLYEAASGVDRLEATLKRHKKAVYVGIVVMVVVRYAGLWLWG